MINGNTNIVFWGACNQGAKALESYKINHLNNEQFIGFYDSKKKGNYLGYSIISLDEIKKDISVVITVESSYVIAEIYNYARKLGIINVFLYSEYKYKNLKEGFLEEYCISCEEWGESVLPQVEMHAVDFCNLNCRGCTHFSPIFEKNIPNTIDRLNDVKVLNSKFTHIIRFYLLGGEPFLNPEISTYISELRSILFTTEIYIVTNGLNLIKIEDKILENIKSNHIAIIISEYEPTHRRIDEIIERLNKFGIKYEIRSYDFKSKFNLPLSTVENSIYPFLCISDGCLTIWEGKIARCPTLMYVNRLNQVFKTNLPTEGIFALEDLTDKKIIELTSKKVPLCRHCIRKPIDWSQCSREPELEDFLVNE